MLPSFRLAVSSPVAAHRALVGRVLTSARLDRGDGDPDAFAPAWSDGAIAVTTARWAGDDYDLLALDDEVWRSFGRHGRCEVRIVDDGAEPERLAESALQMAVCVPALRRLDEPGLGDAVLPADPRRARGDVRSSPAARRGRSRPRARHVALGAAARAAREPLAAAGGALPRRRAPLGRGRRSRSRTACTTTSAGSRRTPRPGRASSSSILESLSTPRPLVERTQALVA